MIRATSNPRKRMITEINITPFTDVCLVLLIIFMVTATSLTRQANLRIDLPKAVTAETALPASVTVQITRDQRVVLNYDCYHSPVTFPVLAARLKHLHAAHGTRLLVVQADEGIPYRLVIETIDTARQVGLDQIALATRKAMAPLERHTL